MITELKNELGMATEQGDVDRVKELMEKVTVSDMKIKREGLGKTPLMIACTYGQLPVVEEFLQVCLYSNMLTYYSI